MTLQPGRAINALTLAIDHQPLPADEIVVGAPATGTAPLGSISGAEVGIWEMTPGAATDIEADELFMVLAGRARIEFTDRDLPALEIGPGDIVRLESGMHTRWTVTETLRKIWMA